MTRPDQRERTADPRGSQRVRNGVRRDLIYSGIGIGIGIGIGTDSDFNFGFGFGFDSDPPPYGPT